MLKLIDYEIVRRLHDQENWSIRRIAAELHHCRKKLAQVLNDWDGTVPRYQLTKPRPTRVVTAELERWVEEILRADAAAPRKQRHTARKIHQRLPAQFPDLSVGESTVRRLVRAVREKMRSPSTTIPLAFAPGEECQIDWGEAQVRIDGETTVIQLLLVALCYSRRTFAMAFEAANQESFCEGQLRAFEEFGGCTARAAYDNLKSAVKKVLVGGEREENEFFKSFRVHNGFEARYCTPGIEGAHEKGRVERKVSAVRLNAFVPIPEVSSLPELNAFLLERCRSLAERQHPDDPTRTVAEVFEEERNFLIPLQKHRFRACKVVASRADGHARVQYQRCLYSLPSEYGRRSVETRAYFDKVEFYHGLTLVASWPRSYRPGTTNYDYRHYLDAPIGN